MSRRFTAADPRCRCGHAADAHDHYRPGSDCGICGTTATAPAGGLPCEVYRPANAPAWRDPPETPIEGVLYEEAQRGIHPAPDSE